MTITMKTIMMMMRILPGSSALVPLLSCSNQGCHPVGGELCDHQYDDYNHYHDDDGSGDDDDDDNSHAIQLGGSCEIMMIIMIMVTMMTMTVMTMTTITMKMVRRELCHHDY